jgi:hypothetical protein
MRSRQLEIGSEPVTDGQSERERIDFDRADIGSVEFRVGVDVEPASIEVDEPAGQEVDVYAELSCRAEGGTQVELCPLQRVNMYVTLKVRPISSSTSTSA